MSTLRRYKTGRNTEQCCIVAVPEDTYYIKGNSEYFPSLIHSGTFTVSYRTRPVYYSCNSIDQVKVQAEVDFNQVYEIVKIM